MHHSNRYIKRLEKHLRTDFARAALAPSLDDKPRSSGFANLYHSTERCAVLYDGSDTLIGVKLNDCQLQSIPIEVFRFSNLKCLLIGGNSIQKIPSQILQLKHLQDILIANNGMLRFPGILLDLPRLSGIFASGNKFSTAPSNVFLKPSLSHVDLANNHIISLPSDAARSRLPLTIEGKEEQEGIYLQGNPLGNPPLEIVRRGQQAIAAYFDAERGSHSAITREETRTLSEVKLIIVGAGGAGKTTLSRRLQGKSFNSDEGKTPGINISSLKVQAGDEEVRVHVWDFGGQEIMHATHQFFLTDRSIYVLVLDSRKDEAAEYWLKHIRSFGGGSPILVVLNKMDENPGFDVNRRFLAEKYPSIAAFYSVSCKTQQGIERFAEGLSKAVSEVEIRRTMWPASWFAVKESLLELDKPFMSYAEYREICDRHGLKERKGQEILVTFLHDLGVVVHFDDFVLQDTHVLEPRWLTGAVYAILNSKEVAFSQGIIRLSELPGILGRSESTYTSDKHPYVVGIMEKFELCYRLGTNEILIPSLLPVGEPEIEGFGQRDTLHFRVEYDFLPPSIMPRLMVRRHESIKGSLRWRTGVVLEEPLFSATAVVRSDMSARRIEIRVEGDGARDLLTVLRAELRDLARSFKNLGATEMVPLPDNPKRAVSFKHLQKLERHGAISYFPDGAEHPYELKELIGTIVVERRRTEDEFLEVVRRAIIQSDSDESAVEKANDILILQPSFAGLGININKLIKKVREARNK